MSPRMFFALLWEAERMYRTMTDDAHSDGKTWMSFHQDDLGYLPGPMQEELAASGSVRQSLASMVNDVAECLRQARIPTRPRIAGFRHFAERGRERRGLASEGQYLEKGGTVDDVVTMIFSRGAVMNIEGAYWDGYIEGIEGLKACRNDNEIGFVLGMCGYKREYGAWKLVVRD